MKKVSLVIIGLGGRGHNAYQKNAELYPDEVEITAIADPVEERLRNSQKELGLPDSRCFATGEELLEQPRLADAAVIATQDRQHVAHAVAAMKKGYHLLLEKPVAIDIQGCKAVLDAARKYNRKVTVCHVLRYAPLYETIKTMIEDNAVGDVVAIQAMENVGYWHFAHSYVRGNWRRLETSSPMILAKCCHDMDLLIWLAGSRAKRVSSYGGLYYFNSAHAPEKATPRCIDCPVRKECAYDAVNFYLESEKTGVAGGHTKWPVDVLALNPSIETITEALKEGPYGRCVFKSDNDVADHQAVNIELESGATINFTVSAFSEKCYRTIRVTGTTGAIEGNLDTGIVIKEDFLTDTTEKIDVFAKKEKISGHGGGDSVMFRRFIDNLQDDTGKETLSGIEASIESHVVALLAEQSRLNGGESIPVTLQ